MFVYFEESVIVCVMVIRRCWKRMQMKSLLLKVAPNLLLFLAVLMINFAPLLGVNTAVYSQAHDHIYLYKIQPNHSHHEHESSNVIIFPDSTMANLKWNLVLPDVQLNDLLIVHDDYLDTIWQNEVLPVDLIFTPPPEKPPRQI